MPHRRLSPSRLKALDTVVIYADTSRPWMMAAYACWRQGFTVGTIYATLGEEGALFGINQSKCKAVVRQQALRVASWWRDSSPRWPQLSALATAHRPGLSRG